MIKTDSVGKIRNTKNLLFCSLDKEYNVTYTQGKIKGFYDNKKRSKKNFSIVNKNIVYHQN
jgi:hypothetical protein